MEPYIKKSEIVAEIERKLSFFHELANAYEEGREYSYRDILSFLENLEVKEVDLEKEVRNFLNVNYTSVEEPDEFLTTTMQIDDMTKFAEHFYALGLNVNQTNLNAQDLIEKYVSIHADNRWLDASELEQLLNDFVLEYDVIKKREYEQQCKCKSE